MHRLLKFTKMHGLGNDFMVINATAEPCHLSVQQIRQLADRHQGIGFDQLLIVESSPNPDTDFNYRIYNGDGSSAEQCGNGARCIAKFIREEKLSQKKTLKIQAPKTVIEISFPDQDTLLVNMGIPIFDPQHLPMKTSQTSPPYSVSVKDIASQNLVSYDCYIVSIGNPHAIIFVTEFDSLLIEQIGEQFNQNPCFPEGINVNFVRLLDAHHIDLQVYERGVGKTLACGSGACASAVITIAQQLAKSPLTVSQLGGDLTISWEGKQKPIMMQGPATTVFRGECWI